MASHLLDLRPVTRGAAEARTPRRQVSWLETAMRDGVEAFLRDRRPDARIVHELVMSYGSVRADVCAVSPDHIIAAEIKSAYDTAERLIKQVALFRLAVPELWLFVDQRFARDCEMLTHLLPSLGWGWCSEAEARRAKDDRCPVTWTIERDAAMFRPDRETLLSLMWSTEFAEELTARRIIQSRRSRPPTLKQMMDRALSTLSDDEAMAAVCRQLRGRNAEWKADPPILDEERPALAEEDRHG